MSALIPGAKNMSAYISCNEVDIAVYLNWNLHAPSTGKKGILKTILSRAYTSCSIKRYLHGEIKYIDSTFEKVKNYPKYVINQLISEAKLKRTRKI